MLMGSLFVHQIQIQGNSLIFTVIRAKRRVANSGHKCLPEVEESTSLGVLMLLKNSNEQLLYSLYLGYSTTI